LFLTIPQNISGCFVGEMLQKKFQHKSSNKINLLVCNMTLSNLYYSI
jgi:hypothetical protein